MIEWDIRVESSGVECQDRAAILEIGQSHVTVVADGAGGLSGGREAAEAVARNLEALRPAPHEARTALFWCEALWQVDSVITVDPSAGETTAVVVAATGSTIVGASVGDSGAFLFTDDTFIDLTAEQPRKPFLGSGRAAPAGFGPVPFAGTLVVASDGLLKYAAIQQIWNCVKHTEVSQAARALAELPRLPSGGYPDDVAVAVVRPR